MKLTRFAICAALAGCTQFPELADSEGPGVADAAYPRLLSVSELRAIPDSTPRPRSRSLFWAGCRRWRRGWPGCVVR